MKQIATILFSFLLVFTFLGSASGQTTLINDDFDSGENGKGQIGSTLDLTGVDWNVDVSNGEFSDNDDFFAVKNKIFEAQDVGGDVIWESESFSISGYTNIDI
ncbi:MAG: hypothetical protein U5K72_09485 [Balneolaceae bacterium]|nr:hypothetical protein [Balneolaceae bacterium]